MQLDLKVQRVFFFFGFRVCVLPRSKVRSVEAEGISQNFTKDFEWGKKSRFLDYALPIILPGFDFF